MRYSVLFCFEITFIGVDTGGEAGPGTAGPQEGRGDGDQEARLSPSTGNRLILDSYCSLIFYF